LFEKRPQQIWMSVVDDRSRLEPRLHAEIAGSPAVNCVGGEYPSVECPDPLPRRARVGDVRGGKDPTITGVLSRQNGVELAQMNAARAPIVVRQSHRAPSHFMTFLASTHQMQKPIWIRRAIRIAEDQ
jgi:hypothetical protein